MIQEELFTAHSHSIVNLGLEPFGDGASAWSRGVDTINDTENHARQLMAVIGTPRSINARFV
ncbi:hypothetical protein WK03_19250 [Burkholderia cepacia]|uniref:hypothetical protein n=1 Tax=Burkholderia cepacia TaxID=292 RepID=UPI00076C5703|nr:hypothetical protein [Burkholderia cepacia]KVQ43330.1 hypothetical protein WK03_19250 [Burkholderia cepacia]